MVQLAEDRDGIEGYPMVAVLASLFSGLMGSQPPAGGEPMRSIDGRMRTQPAPVTLRLRRGPPCSQAILCRRDRTDARRRRRARAQVRGGELPDASPSLTQGIARILCADLDGGGASLEDAVSVGEDADALDDAAVALCERSVVAMARSRWDRAEVLAGRARTVLRRAGSRRASRHPHLRAASPRSHAPGRCPGGAPGTSQCPAPEAVADLRASPPRGPGPDRAGPRPPRARRPGRGQDAHARGR
jgi:hypothetical protein